MKLRLLLTTLFATSALAHLQPTTLVTLDAQSDRVAMNLHVPLNELELAFGHGVQDRPEERVAEWGPALRQYLVDHIRPTTPSGQAWTVQVGSLTIEKAEQSQSGPFQEVTALVSLIPPAGADIRRFTLNYDVIMHQVVTHKAIISVRDVSAPPPAEPARLGVIAVNTATSRIDPFAVQLNDERSGMWTLFRAMVALGMQHIREGLDHLLFLIVLLLPATLKVNGRSWNGFGGGRYSLIRLVRIVSAFTLGHSLTLLAGALNWLILPQRPVEVLIACSILVTAVHAIRPIFPGREARVAAGFGLVHGLAFATVLANMNLAGGQLALSILGFNLGIELMQLFVIALTAPWLILLSMTPAHPWVRVPGAILAGIAAVGWIANRVSGESNAVERFMNVATEFAPLGILILALIAIPAYLRARVFANGELSD